MNKAVAKAQADSLDTWADQWSRDQAEGSSEAAFLMRRAARMMRGEVVPFIEPLPAAIPQELAAEG